MNKKLFLLLLIVTSFTIPAFSQSPNFVYCELVGTGKFLSNKVNVQVDFGQATSFWKGVDYLKDEEGKKITFNSMVDAMNYMVLQGWEFVQAYVITTGNQNVYHWLLKKELTTEQLEQVVNDK